MNARYALGTFESFEEARRKCIEILDSFLNALSEGSADDVYSMWSSFGDDPWISGPKAQGQSFSATEYVREWARQRFPAED